MIPPPSHAAAEYRKAIVPPAFQNIDYPSLVPSKGFVEVYKNTLDITNQKVLHPSLLAIILIHVIII